MYCPFGEFQSNTIGLDNVKHFLYTIYLAMKCTHRMYLDFLETNCCSCYNFAICWKKLQFYTGRRDVCRL
jgi:hypothetical protein